MILIVHLVEFLQYNKVDSKGSDLHEIIDTDRHEQDANSCEVLISILSGKCFVEPIQYLGR